jgi:bifunctional non-homologous end joining protein LigD
MPVTWVEPKYVCELKFTDWTSDGKLRHPIFVRLREDKTFKDLSAQRDNTSIMENTKETNAEVSQPEEGLKKRSDKK